MDSRKKFFSLLLAALALLLGCGLPANVTAADDFQSSVRAPLSPAQAAELRAAAESASFAAQSSRGPTLGISQAQAQAQPSSYRIDAASPLQQQKRLISAGSIPEAPGWMVFLVCFIIALVVARRAFGGPRA
jgi:hypothetical protein